ncbi:Eco57I restriction-modification methylase domain-containing protein [Cyanobacterium aponinum]|uniref:Eco57I restriction-modification methylase domain-containing protein n=1 Tax=Cyanobacterium aponinum TaxID=379064 RepID=UPI000C12DBFB|nr:Eco57I restriction-modification methylase domain-containing protein [Cyanobacterium aponinum]PHV63759.1 hypothetical protein CSQ80_04095 [Cyanobacterium aponinum IPPAS B-1201]
MPKNNIDLKSNILDSLASFPNQDMVSSIEQFYQTLGYFTELNVELDNASPTDFLMMINQDKDSKRLLLDEWQSVDYLFQLTEEQIKKVTDIPEFNINYINSYLFLTITLKKNYYSRTQLSSITREINKLSAIPIMLTFRHGNSLTLAIIDRRPNQKDNDKDVLQKITLIKDINFVSPHRAHLEILNDFALSTIIKNNKPENFDDLHKAWRKVLDTSALNKQFYREIANWYFWAVKTVNFPSIIEDKTVNNATNIIRLITRLIFVWFLKEKGLIPNTLFNVNSVTKIIGKLEDEESTYYKAILQNLFFATLNTEIKPDNRQFNDSPNSYRYQDYFEDTKQFLELTANIPFLNGGLFECLDKEMLIDGFSESSDNPLTVPNKLFFGGEETIDLSKVYGSKKRSKEKVRGIINIFNDYKFTIDENTPIDEEIALDPELLGKVFENLLAEYNPETETTARKQTGSFYTPREIVNYMVDESIIAYLKQQLLNDSSGYVELGSNQTNLFGNEHNQQQTLQTKVEDNPFIGKEDELESNLRELLSFSEVNPFTPDISQKLITAIDSLKILDPACGSGAFPMGILQKLVHILSKLDPHNDQWRNQQKERAIAPLLADIKQAEKISYEEARDKAIEQLQTRLQQIEDEFNNNEQDYPRKLFLIENCIYGVDIQPIAVQISKLRFFISLIVEQKVNDNHPNRGILPLPNLETKFVSANTLIGIDNQTTLRTEEVYQKEAELKKVRHNYFSADNPQDKQRCKQQDQQLRTEITTLLKSTGLQGAIADTLARWNPYDQNSSSDFFDSEWMFGVTGFDIVIGNPPYMRIQEIQKNSPKLAQYLKDKYISASGSFDIYCCFIEIATKLINLSGNVAYIVPHKFFQGAFGKKLRGLISKDKMLKQIVDFGSSQVFESATTYTCLLFLSHNNPEFKFIELQSDTQLSDLVNILELVYSNSNLETNKIKIGLISNNNLNDSEWNFSVGENAKILAKLKSQPLTLADVCDKIFVGLQTSADKIYFLEHKSENKGIITAYSNSLNCDVQIEKDFVKPLLKGADVHRYQPLEPKIWCIFPYKLNQNQAVLYTQQEIKTKFPLAWQYLLANKTDLENRESGRFKDEWWCFSRPQNMTEFEQKKIITPEISYGCNITLDTTGLYHNTKCYSFIFKDNKKQDLKYYLALLNSSILWFYLTSTGYVLRGGYFTFKTNYLMPFPIPKATEAQKEAIEKIVDEILGIKKNNPSADTRKLEREIDLLVYELYGLTEEEINIVEGNN